MSDNHVTSTTGTLVATGHKMVVVASRFNGFITERLVEAALDTLVRCGARREDQRVVWVPGAWEIPLAAKRVAEVHKPHAVVCLGCVIRGSTAHFEQVAGEASKGVAAVSLATGIPMSNGILATENLEQAIDRAGGKMGNKGAEAAAAAVEMVNVLKAIDTRAAG